MRGPSPSSRGCSRLDLLTHESALVREGIALAFLLSPETGDAEALSEALTDSDPMVRMTAARALAGIVSRESLGALIGAMRKEPESQVAVLIADTLRKLTGQNLGRNPDAWHRWWEANKDSKALQGLEEEVKRRKLGGIPLETVTVAPRARAPGEKEKPRLDFLVLAPFGFTHGIYRPWLDEVTKYGRITYVKLPRISELTGSDGYGAGVPEYPVGRLVKALEGLRKELGKEQVVIVAEGASGWIAQRYALTYPKRTAALVIVNGYVDSLSYAAALFRQKRSPVPGERWVAECLTNPGSHPHDRATYDRISRITLTSRLADARDSRGFLLWRNARDPQGFASVPDISYHPRMKIETPAVFFFGVRHRASGLPEAERIRQHWRNHIIAPLQESRGFGYVSEYDEFYRILEGFLRRYGLI